MRIRQQYEFIDLIVAIGLCATIVGAGLLFMVGNGSWQVRTMSVDLAGADIQGLPGMQWVQPVLGHAIVEHEQMERARAQVAGATHRALTQLAQERGAWAYPAQSDLQALAAEAGRVERDHAARVQAVMGRSIVTFARQGARLEGGRSVAQQAAYTDRMVDVAGGMGRKMNADFNASWQPALGWAIVSAAAERLRGTERVEERTGQAIVRSSTVEAWYAQRQGVHQPHAGATLVLAAMIEQQGGARGGRPELPTVAQVPTLLGSERVAWPEIANRFVVLASAGLMAVFLAGVLFLAPLRLRRAVDA